MIRSSRKSDDLQSFKVFKVFRYLTIFSQIFYKKAVLKYFTKFTEKHLCMKHAKHTILWGMPSTLFYESLNACYFMKHVKPAILWLSPSTPIFWRTQSTSFYEACQTRKHAKDASTAITWAHQARKARQARDHASTLFRKLYFCQCNFCLCLSCRNTFLNKFPIAASRNQFSVYLLKQYSFIWRFFMLVEIQFLKNNIFRANENWFSG